MATNKHCKASSRQPRTWPLVSVRTGAIHSWDEDIWSFVTSGKGRPGNFIVIIDPLCNLDLLFYAAAQSGNSYLSQVAEAHTGTALRSHIRPEPSVSRKGYHGTLYSSNHVANFSPSTDEIIETLTAQGYSATSKWPRGQAWGILGFAQTYMWTKKREFLHAACRLAEYFLHRMETAPSTVKVGVEAPDGTTRKTGRFVPVWDFDAPVDEFSPPLRDTSAGTAAASGLLILSQVLAAEDKALSSRYFEAAIMIVEDTVAYSLSQDQAKIFMGVDDQLTVSDLVSGKTFKAILRNATVTNNLEGRVQIRDHGLVYGDYYLIEFGTQLLRMGLL